MSWNSEHMKRLRAKWKASGLCTRCGGEKPCLVCRQKRREYVSNKPLNGERTSSSITTIRSSVVS